MIEKNRLFHILGLTHPNKKTIERLSSITEISMEKLNYYNKNSLLPSPLDLEKIQRSLGIHKFKVMIGLEIYDREFKRFLQGNLDQLTPFIDSLRSSDIKQEKLGNPDFRTANGKLYQADCIQLMKKVNKESVDLVFADPPFNLNKTYRSEIDDALPESQYLEWCEEWLDESIRILKPGGSLFIWNLPKWNIYLSAYLTKRLSFRHWIATDIKYSLPIPGKLYPSHYSLLYFVKGEKANKFHPDRMPMEVCKNCYKEIKDYGGYKDKMNPKGINLSDVWCDIPPVRHKKYKAREEANELSIKLIDRIIEISTDPGDTIFDPFGGSGTTYIVAEIKKRKWIGTEIGPINGIIERFSKIDVELDFLNKIRDEYNSLFTKEVKKNRQRRALWTDETFKEKDKQLTVLEK